MPNNRFQTSEITLKKGGSAKVAVGQGNEIEFTPDFSNTWSDVKNPRIKADEFVVGQLSYSFLERFELTAKYLTDLGLIGSGKFQMVGTPGEEGFQMSGVFQAGGGSETKEEDQVTPTKAELDNYFYGADVILGYRNNKGLVVYTSAFRDQSHFKITQSRGSDVRHYKGKSTNTGGTAGLSYDLSQSASIMFEFARAKAVSADSRLTSSSFGGALTLYLP